MRGLGAAAVQGPPLGGHETVVDDAVQVGVDGHPAMVGVPQDVIQVVGGVDARQDGLEVGQPGGIAEPRGWV